MEYLRGAIDDADGLAYDGTETDNGLMVEDGVTYQFVYSIVE